jgi:hypothetical protein
MPLCGTVASVISVRAVGALALLSSTIGGCLLYTDEINEAPSLTIQAPTFEPFRGADTTVTAQVSDDRDGLEALQVSWVKSEGPCPADPDAAPPAPDLAAMPGRGLLQFILKIQSFGPVCLFARATDTQGASGPWRHKQFQGKNRAPRAAFEITPRPRADGSIPLYSRVVVSPAKSVDDDGDPLTHHWQITTPDGPLDQASSRCAPDAPAGARCFVPHTPGQVTIQLVVQEALPPGLAVASSAPEMTALMVDDDRPPCLEQSDPEIYQKLVLIETGRKAIFSVSSVRDDGEPYPGPGEKGQTIFVWSVSKPGGKLEDPLEYLTVNRPSIEVSDVLFGNPRPGDQFRLRVEVRDAEVQTKLGLGRASPICLESQDVCKDRSRDGAECVRWTTWTVQFHP